MEPENGTPGIGDSFWKPSFSGSMLNLGSVWNPCSGFPIISGGHFTSAVTNINSQTWIQKNSANHPKVWTKMFTSRWIFWLNESAFHGWKCDCDLFWDGEFHVTRKGGPKGHFHWIIWSLWFTFSCAMSIHIKLTPSTQLRSPGKIVTPVPSNAQHFQWGGLPIWTAK